MLNNINHKMAVYKDCTLVELMITAVVSLSALTLLFSLLTKILFGMLWPGYLIASLLFVFLTKFLLSKIEKLKYGKPYGYYQHLFLKMIYEVGLIHSRYIIRVGRWSVRRVKR